MTDVEAGVTPRQTASDLGHPTHRAICNWFWLAVDEDLVVGVAGALDHDFIALDNYLKNYKGRYI
jgi:hypothetical protein